MSIERSLFHTRALAALALTLACACTMGPQGVTNRYTIAEGQREPTKVVNNQMLETAIKLQNLITTHENGIMLAQFDLVNTRQGQVAFQWTVEWFDKRGILIDYVSRNWTPERLAAGASKTVKIRAPSPEATSFRLQIGSRDEVQ
jgi:uncharacterized protein YcfL